ncbi:MAG: WXG100 family type VII secretion target [Lachnospiraceae bacterium]|nr:WXG100 family type VII secretion target [Lachnospiraceae bacterium]
MAIVLKVEPDTLVQMAEEIESQLNDIQNQFTQVESDINATRSYWEGEASDAHKSQYDALKEEISETLGRLKNHPTNLLKMAGLYTETESELEELAQTLAADVIV